MSKPPVSKGLSSVVGGIPRPKNAPAFNIPQPKLEEPEPIIEREEPKVEDNVPAEPEVKVAEVIEGTPISLDVDYFEALKNYKPKYETHKQITVRISNSLDAELNKICKGKKGAKQELISRGIEREVALIKLHEKKMRSK